MEDQELLHPPQHKIKEKSIVATNSVESTSLTKNFGSSASTQTSSTATEVSTQGQVDITAEKIGWCDGGHHTIFVVKRLKDGTQTKCKWSEEENSSQRRTAWT